MSTKRIFLLSIGILLLVTLLVSPSFAGRRDIYMASTDGYVFMPDGVKVYIRGFVGCNIPKGGPENFSETDCPPVGTAVLPSPIIDVDQGDDVFVHLINTGNVNKKTPTHAHTIHFHGIHATTQNDGFPENSFEVPVPGPGAVNKATYYFFAEKPGTYMWHCHVEASEHVQLGMYGAMIIRPSKNRTNSVFGGGFNDTFDHEYVVLVSDIDKTWHDMVEKGRPFNAVNFKPDYWLVNGRAFPDNVRTIVPPKEGIFDIGPPEAGAPSPRGHVPGSNNLSTYKSFLEVPYFEKATATKGPRILVRLINMSYQTHPWHQHGWHFVKVGKDASPVPVSSQREEYTSTIGSGETHDLVITAIKRDTYGGNLGYTYANQSPPSGPAGRHELLTTPALCAVLGVDPGCEEVIRKPYPQAACATAAPGRNDLSIQWFPAHNHDDYKVTNNGHYPGGMATLLFAHPGPPKF